MQALHTGWHLPMHACPYAQVHGCPKEARCLGTRAGKHCLCTVLSFSVGNGSAAACLQSCSELTLKLWTGVAACVLRCVALMASRTLTRILSPLLNWAAPRYQAAVGDVLRKHGLRYEDLYDPLLNQVCVCSSERLLRLPSEPAFIIFRLGSCSC